MSQVCANVNSVDLTLDVKFAEQRAWIASLPSLDELAAQRPCRSIVRSELMSELSLPKVVVATEYPGGSSDLHNKREKRFRNVMRRRGGRVRTNEEMQGSASTTLRLDAFNLSLIHI